MCGFIPGDDLVSWAEFKAKSEAFEAELDAAAGQVQDANLRYNEALRRFRCAPHGELQRRRGDLRTANARVLNAELAFAEIQKREPHW